MVGSNKYNEPMQMLCLTMWKHQKSYSESVEVYRIPRGTNNTGSPHMTEDTSTGG